MRAAGSSLLELLLGLYPQSKVSAKDFTIACHYANEATIPEGKFALYAVAPGQASDGAYQRRLDTVLPGPSPMYFVNVPSQSAEEI